MMVTFVSECEKNALPKTRRVLDAFANRIGSRTWQTVITNDGLDAVKKLLRKTASKNTAVSCHWIRSRSRSELVWIVGNRQKFNEEGVVPVNRTQKDLLHQHWEDDWDYLPLIKSLTALAALFHDWGKASELFQEKLDPKKGKQFKGDPLRHEWISVIFLVAYVAGEKDEEWLERLIKGEFDTAQLQSTARESIKHSSEDSHLPKPLYKLPPAAALVAWLVVSHHRLPVKECNLAQSATTLDGLFKKIRQDWGYENRFDEAEFQRELPRCFNYLHGLPSDAQHWRKAVRKHAERLKGQLNLLNEALQNGTIRIILNHARLALMLGDHYYSSLEPGAKNRLTFRELKLYANTDSDGKLKQTLDEHLLGVTQHAQRVAHFLPMFEGKNDELPYAHDVNALRRKSPAAFVWQDKAVDTIGKWRKAEEKQNPHHFGFFAVNMASTGKGKTFANAKIMRALSFDAKRLRYVLALGLRTLTLQTGDEYRTRIGLKNDELAVLIGSKAVLSLHNQKHKDQQAVPEFIRGSESEEQLLDNEVNFDCLIPEGDLQTVLRNDKDKKFLYAPVLACTIDHFMSATETKRGGRYILPSLRLMSSDLVIDEVDDFDGQDLIAIGRLIHLAGMSGRKVMISSATIPPDLAEGYFNAYQAGWALFATMRKLSPIVGCAWIDENKTKIESVNCQIAVTANQRYQALHTDFVAKRIAFLNTEPVKRKAALVSCDPAQVSAEQSKQNYYFSVIQAEINRQHRAHCYPDHKTGKQVSFGVVRMANITPCVELTEYLLDATWSDDVDVRIMTYHSRQVLLMRHDQEKHLDAVLKRNPNDDQAIFNHPRDTVVRTHLDQSKKPQVIFIAVVSPVEEVGRDHDWDWAIIEPSSYRSIIQMAGRVLRHRQHSPTVPNIALLQYNLNGFLGKKPAFTRPGYESAALALITHDLSQLLGVSRLQERLDASPRILRQDTLAPEKNLADLEHESIHRLLTHYELKGPESLQGWLSSYWWLTGVPQLCVRFRASQPMITMYLVPTEDGDELFEKDRLGYLATSSSGKLRRITHQEELSQQARERLWIYRDYRSLLEALVEDETANLKKQAATYGELSVPIDERSNQKPEFTYSSQLGLVKRRPSDI